MAVSFVILVPVKAPGAAKSRLAGLGDRARQGLALAFAQDTITAALSSQDVLAVVVATSESPVADWALAAGCEVVADPGDLNEALRDAAVRAEERWPGSTPVAVCSDLPALSPHDLGLVLAALPGDRAAYVADAGGSGTTMYAAPVGQFDPEFGADSAARHRAAGAVEVARDVAAARLDVDTPDDLARARALGVGDHTRLFLRAR